MLLMFQDWTSTSLGGKVSNSFLHRNEFFLPTLRFSDSSEPMAFLEYSKIILLSNQTVEKNAHFTLILKVGGRIFPLIKPKSSHPTKFYKEISQCFVAYVWSA